MTDILAEQLFDFDDVSFKSIFEEDQPIWHVLQKGFKEDWILKYINANVHLIQTKDGLVQSYQKIKTDGGTFEVHPGVFIKDEGIEIQAGCVLEPGCFIAGPLILGKETVVRHGAYIRGGVLTGKNCVIGHATEVKSSIFLNGAKAAHFAYVGDSVLGNHVNLGAGTKVSNVKITLDEISVKKNNLPIPTGLRKMGAIIGDHSQVGCNAVLNPGTILCPRTLVYPNTSVRSLWHKKRAVLR